MHGHQHKLSQPSRHASLALTMFVAIFSSTRVRAAEYESGDPRGLRGDTIRAIRDALVTVHVPAEKNLFRSRGFDEEPFTSQSLAKEIERGNYRVRYPFDDYMVLREAEIYHELGLRAWTVDFTGGPLHLWWIHENVGDVDTSELIDGSEGGATVHIINDSKSGRLLYWYLPGASNELRTPRGRKIMSFLRTHGSRSRGIPFMGGLQVIDGHSSEWSYNHPESDPWLWSDWNGVKFTRHTPQTKQPIRVDGQTLLLDIEAAEQSAPKNGTPRRLRLKLMAKPKREGQSR